MKGITQNGTNFLIFYVVAALTFLTMLYSLSPLGEGMEPLGYIIASLAILILVGSMRIYREFWTDFRYEKYGITIKRPSLIFPLIRSETFVRYDEIEYALVVENHGLSNKNPYFAYRIETLTIVDRERGKKYSMAIEGDIKKGCRERILEFRRILKGLSDASREIGEDFPIFVQYVLETNMKEALQHMDKTGFVRIPAIDPDFFFYLLEKYFKKEDTGCTPEDLKIPDDIPHIDLKKDEKPEEKLREMKMKEMYGQ